MAGKPGRIGLTETVIAKIGSIHEPGCGLRRAFGHHAGPNPERGVYRSKDGGKTWDKILFRDDKTGANELIIDPNNPQVIYVALWEAYRNAYEMSSGGPGSGIFKSTDGGDHWTEISRAPGLPKAMLGKIGLSVSGADSNRVYAQIEADDGGFFLSDDAGATWQKVSERRDLRQRAFYYTRVYADPKVKDTVWVLNVDIYKSTDAGKTWKSVAVPHGDNHDLWIAANDSNRMIEANDGGGTVSVNGGETWTPETMPTAQFYHVTPGVPYHICGAQQDNSTACVPASPPEARGIQRRISQVFYSVGGGERLHRQRSATRTSFSPAATAAISRLDRRTGRERAINPYPDTRWLCVRHRGALSVDVPDRARADKSARGRCRPRSTSGNQQRGQAGQISPSGAARSQNHGRLGRPITKDNTGVETYATVFTIALRATPTSSGRLGRRYVQVTRNGGTSWKNVTPKALGVCAHRLIDVAVHAGTAYVAANRYHRDDFKPSVFRTTTAERRGRRSRRASAPTTSRAIRGDVKRGCYSGPSTAFTSFDGANWQSLRQNLPDTPVHDIAVEERDLVIATHGRGFYVMDNLSPLRQGGLPATSTFQLYKPEDARRGLDRSVAIDYYLKQPAQTVTMAFLDAQGKAIRTFTGTPADAERKPPSPGDDDGPRRPPAPHPAVSAACTG
jgi:photosystem II stability/assembly factor-like uncharacterized protein